LEVDIWNGYCNGICAASLMDQLKESEMALQWLLQKFYNGSDVGIREGSCDGSSEVCLRWIRSRHCKVACDKSEAVIFDCFLQRLLQDLLQCVGCRI